MKHPVGRASPDGNLVNDLYRSLNRNEIVQNGTTNAGKITFRRARPTMPQSAKVLHNSLFIEQNLAKWTMKRCITYDSRDVRRWPQPDRRQPWE